VPRDGTGRAYQPPGPKPGLLIVSLHPPTGHENPLIALSEQIESFGMPESELLHSGITPGAIGSVATMLYRVPKVGLFQFWLVASEVTVFATYEMGAPQNARKEFAEAAQIIEGMCFEDGEWP
jgi:hypothetical protein